MLRLDFSTPSARRLRTFNTLLLPEDLEIPSDEAFATFQPSKGTSKVYSRFSQGLSFFEGLDSPRSFGSAALFFDERKSLTFIVWGECRSSKFSLVSERHLKWCSQRGGLVKVLRLGWCSPRGFYKRITPCRCRRRIRWRSVRCVQKKKNGHL